MKLLLYAILLATHALGEEGMPYLRPELASEEITWKETNNLLKWLSWCGTQYNKDRSFGSLGYNKSSSYVLERIDDFFENRLDIYIQPYTQLWEKTKKISLTGPDGERVKVTSLAFNPPTSGITALLVNTPIDDRVGSACFEDQWQGIDAKGKIALIRHGKCPISDKVRLAKRHGALAVMLYDDSPKGDWIEGATLGDGTVGQVVPVGLVSSETAREWIRRLAADQPVQVSLVVDSILEERKSWNIIVETKDGDPDNVVMLGAHLDSARKSPGLNDNASGVILVLQAMDALTRYTGLKQKVRFAFWGSNKHGLIGSRYYISQLSNPERDKIRFYFNFDVVGTKRPIWAVFADNDDHKFGAAHMLTFLRDQGMEAFYSNFRDPSDYLPFLEVGIPCSGIFTGSGEAICYKKWCDKKRFVSSDTTTMSAKAATYAVATLALGLEGLPPRNSTRI